MSFYKGTDGNYTIKAGDNLSAIAKQAGVSVQDLASWNNIKDVNKISSGAKLYTSNPTASVTPTAKTEPASKVEPNVITMINGEKTVNENDLFKTGVGKESTLPTATQNMKDSGIEYSWSKEGNIQGFLEEQMKVQEARRDAIEQKSKINYGAINKASNQGEIVANQNMNKMGITGMAAADIERNVTVASNARALELYSQEEMISKGYETGVKIAAMFGDLKARQVTAEEYKKASDEAHAQAAITGVYYEPIQMQLLGQRVMSKAILDSPYSTSEEKSRAKQVNKGITNAFLELGITEKGADTITKIYQMEQLKLQEQANSLAHTSNNLMKKQMDSTNRGMLGQRILSEIENGSVMSDDRLKELIKQSGANISLAEARGMIPEGYGNKFSFEEASKQALAKNKKSTLELPIVSSSYNPTTNNLLKDIKW